MERSQTLLRMSMELDLEQLLSTLMQEMLALEMKNFTLIENAAKS
jgi:hypothetical protein